MTSPPTFLFRLGKIFVRFSNCTFISFLALSCLSMRPTFCQISNLMTLVLWRPLSQRTIKNISQMKTWVNASSRRHKKSCEPLFYKRVAGFFLLILHCIGKCINHIFACWLWHLSLSISSINSSMSCHFQLFNALKFAAFDL